MDTLKSAALAAALSATLVLSGPATAADVAKVGTCLLSQCQGALAACLADGTCLKDLVCLNTCNGRPDEIECQLRCGDLYADQATDTFNACAVSEKKCVPQIPDKGSFPVPPPCALDSKFDLSMFDGRWYITAGLNPLFDTFDCQVHYFGLPEPGKLLGKISWRINKPDNDWIQRETIQQFVQDPEQPAVLYNHDNEYLHYQDDWYIVAAKPEQYVFVYYKGSNDAWDGYGGAVVYTREAQLPEEYIPELRVAAESVGLKWEDLKLTDNSCAAHPAPRGLLAQLEDDVEKAERLAVQEARVLEAGLEDSLRSFGRGFTVVESQLERELTAEEELVARELREAAAFLQSIEQKYLPSTNPLAQLLQRMGIVKGPSA